MTKAELIAALERVPDDYTLAVCVANETGDQVETTKVFVRVVNETKEILIQN